MGGGEIWSVVGAVNLVVLACVLRAATKKDRQLFRGKSAPPEKILATPMLLMVAWLRDMVIKLTEWNEIAVLLYSTGCCFCFYCSC